MGIGHRSALVDVVTSVGPPLGCKAWMQVDTGAWTDPVTSGYFSQFLIDVHVFRKAGNSPN